LESLDSSGIRNVTVAATASSLAKWSPQRAKEADERDRDDEHADDHRHPV
jgi:hypothetical protein